MWDTSDFPGTSIGTVPVGRVETGFLKPGWCSLLPPRNAPQKLSLWRQHHEALPGDYVGFNVKDVSRKDIRHRFMMGDSKNDSRPPQGLSAF